MNTREKEPREFYISKSDAEKHGYTRGCGGCSSWFRGLGRQPHTEECRKRFEGLMKDEAKVKNAKRRMEEFEEKQKRARSAYNFQQGGASSSQGPQKRKGEDIEEREVKGEVEGGGLVWWVPKAPTGGETDEEMEPPVHPAKEDRSIGEVSNWDAYCEENLVGGGGIGWEYPGSARELLEEVEVWISEVKVSLMKEIMQDERQVDGWCEQAWDDVHGKELKMEDVRAGRAEEIGYMKSRNIWREVDLEECFRVTGREPLSVKWVDTDKGTVEEPLVRCRLVARDFKGKDEKDREDLFAATPPLELKRVLMSKAVTRRRKRQGVRKLLFIDARKAHLNPECLKDVYIELPAEAGAGPGKCGKLVYWLYGCREAAQAWEEHYSEKMESVGFTRGTHSPVVFYHEEKDLSCVVHGDDFTFEGEAEDLKWIAEKMKEWFEVKIRGLLGPEEADDKEVTILGRVVKWKEWGIEYQADPRHRELIMEYFGFDETTRALQNNGGKEEEEGDDEFLGGEEARSYRGTAARLNYMAQDSPGIMFGTKEACRGMANPTRGDFRRLKKVAKFLVGRLAEVWRFVWQEEGQSVLVYTDSDWAGCRKTRKSSSGGLLMLGSHCIKAWCSTQGALALSSAEAEYYSLVEGVLRARGLQNIGKEIGMDGTEESVKLKVMIDSSAAKAFVSKRGSGKMRHIEVKWLWLQEEVRKGRVEVGKVRGDLNPADLMTKYLNVKEIEQRLASMSIGLEVRDEKVVQEVVRESRLRWWKVKGSKVKEKQKAVVIGWVSPRGSKRRGLLCTPLSPIQWRGPGLPESWKTPSGTSCS